jgi:hypothetical protein
MSLDGCIASGDNLPVLTSIDGGAIFAAANLLLAKASRRCKHFLNLSFPDRLDRRQTTK